jgi:hypothetical protein
MTLYNLNLDGAPSRRLVASWAIWGSEVDEKYLFI